MSDDYFFDVEKILDKRTKNGRIEYKIKWDNYPMCQCTWEPMKNLTNVQYMVDEFNNKLEEKLKNSKSQSRLLGKKRKKSDKNEKTEKNEKNDKEKEDFKKNSKKIEQNTKNNKDKNKNEPKFSSKKIKDEKKEEEEKNNSVSSSTSSLKSSSSSSSSICYSGKKKENKKSESEKKEDNIIIDHSYKKVYTVQIKEGKLVAVVGIKDSHEKYKDNIATDELRKKNPWILLDFYESKIKFT